MRAVTPSLCDACIAGYERMSAWADLLDEINVFPVADADTGRNLRISLTPIKSGAPLPADDMARRLLQTATGNSGNIAAAFFAVFLGAADLEQLAGAARGGARNAWRAVADPKAGTMLTVFDVLAESLESRGGAPLETVVARTVDDLARAVDATADALPETRRAGVVDAGALGMFIFFEALLAALAGAEAALRPPTARFGQRLRRTGGVSGAAVEGACINALVRGAEDPRDVVRQAAGLGDCVVSTVVGRDVKLHLHARHPEKVARRLRRIGELAGWQASALRADDPAPELSADRVHVMTDAAGSLPAALARSLGVTLLDSYIVSSRAARPETLVPPEEVYAALGRGERVSTAQASHFERRERYGSVVSRFDHVLYLCVGSVYTGNHAAACDWCRDNDPEGRMVVIDSGAASGRLGLMALALARWSLDGFGLDAMRRHAAALMARCDELVFLDQLKFLAAGGRISKAGGFFGDLLRVRPVITPTAGGARKTAVVRRRRDQLPLALARMAPVLGDGTGAVILLQYTDNRDRVETQIRPAMAARFPAAEILTVPISLTSGVHMGPGTWAVAFLPSLDPEPAP